LSSDQVWARLHYNVSLVECASRETLDELLDVLGLDQSVVARLSDRVVIVDGQQKAQIARCLARRGHPYRVTDLVPRAPDQDESAWRP